MSWDALSTLNAPPEQEPTYGDYGQIVKGAAGSTAAGAVGGLRYMYDLAGTNSPWADKTFKALEETGNVVAEQATKDMTEGARKRYEAGITSPEFWEHPVSSMAMKATGQIPNFVAMALPGGLIADARMAGAAVIAAGGSLSAGELVNNVYQKVDETSDDDLQKQSPLYRKLYEELGPEKARQQYTQDILGLKPAVAFALGSAEGVFGPIRNIVTGIKGGGRHGIVKSAVGGAGSEFADEGGGALLTQKAEIEGGLRKGYDIPAALDQALTGAALGGVLGGASGIGGRGRTGKAIGDEVTEEQGRGEEVAAVQAPAGQTAVAAGQAGGPTAGAAKSAAQVVAVDPAVKAALDAKTQAPTPPVAPPEVPVPTPTPAPPAAPPVAAAPVASNVQQGQLTPPPVAQPQGVPTTPPPAAPVTPEVTGAPPETLDKELGRIREVLGPAGAAAKPQLDEGTLTEMARRGFTPEEAAQLTPEQVHTIIMQRAAPQTQQVATAQAPVPPGPTGTTTALPVTPTESFGADAPAVPAVPAVNATGGRILQNLSPEAQQNVAATQQQIAGNVKQAAQTPAAERVIGVQKLPKEYAALQTERNTRAKEVHGRHTAEPLEVPDTPEKRKALSAKLKSMIADSGLELREDIDDQQIKNYYAPPKGKKAKDFPLTKEQHARYHRSIPTRLDPKADPHLRYLREMVGVQKALDSGRDLGPKGKNYRRVLNFVAAHNNQEGLDLLALSRKEAGDEIAASKRTAAQQTAAEEGTPAAKATVAAPTSTGAIKGTERVLGENEKAVIGAQVLERLAAKQGQAAATPAAPVAEAPQPKLSKVEQAKATAAKLADKYAPKAEAPAAEKPKPKVTPTVATLVAKTKPKITEETKPEPTEDKPQPRKVWHIIDTEQEGFHEGYRPTAFALNRVRHWVNGLSDAEYNKLSEQPLRMLQDANSVDTVEKIGKWFKEDLGHGPFDTAPTKPEPKSEPKPEPKAEVTPEVTEEVTEKPADVGEKRTTATVAKETPHERIIRLKEEKADAEALAARTAAAAERAKKAKPRATPEQIKAAMAALKAKKEGGPPVLPSNIDVASEEQIRERLAASGGKPRVMQLASDEHDIWDTPIHKTRDIYGHDSNSLSDAVDARDILNNLDLEHLPDLPRYLQGFTRRRLIELVGDIKVYMASPRLVADANGNPKVTPGGYYHPGGGANYSDYIVINTDSMNTQRRFAHVVIHEALHAALYNRIEADAKLRHRIQTLMGHLKSELNYDMSGPGTAKWAHSKYALTNVHEFISEALSNPRLQEIMANIEVPPEMARQLHVDSRKTWTLWGAFVEKVRETLGFMRGTHNLLHETLKAIQPAFDIEHERAAGRGVQTEPLALSMDALRDAAVGIAPNADTKTNLAGKLWRAKNKVSSLFMMARRNEAHFGPSKPLLRLFEARAFMERTKDVILEKFGGLNATLSIARAERDHPEAMAKAKRVLFDSSLHDVNLEGSNDHLGKDKLMGVQAKAEIARLQKEWADPAIDPVRKTIKDAVKFYRDIHNAVSRETINNILAEANINDPALAQRIHESGLTTADREAWADSKLVNALDQVQELKRRHGWYVPFRRYGGFVSTAHHELSTPSNGLKINDNTIQFIDPAPKNGQYGNARARAAVKNYLRSNSHTPQGNKLTPSQVRKVWVDKNNPSEIVEAEDANAITAYRVSMQTQHTEMHETEAEAQNNREALAEAGLVGARAHTREKEFHNAQRHPERDGDDTPVAGEAAALQGRRLDPEGGDAGDVPRPDAGAKWDHVHQKFDATPPQCGRYVTGSGAGDGRLRPDDGEPPRQAAASSQDRRHLQGDARLQGRTSIRQGRSSPGRDLRRVRRPDLRAGVDCRRGTQDGGIQHGRNPRAAGDPPVAVGGAELPHHQRPRAVDDFAAGDWRAAWIRGDIARAGGRLQLHRRARGGGVWTQGYRESLHQ